MKYVTILILFVSFLAIPTFADDAKVYPGALGVRWSSSYPVPSLNNSALLNPSSTQWLNVDLPIIHDSISHDIDYGWVKVLDRNPNSSSSRIYDVRATLAAVHWSNSSDRFRARTYTATPSSGSDRNNVQTLYFGKVNTYTYDHYYISCRIPPAWNGQKSGVVSYKIEEKDGSYLPF